jgi:hypothetical protein
MMSLFSLVRQDDLTPSVDRSVEISGDDDFATERRVVSTMITSAVKKKKSPHDF